MAREDLHFRLRLPEALKDQIESAASENHRSMTAEIVARLEASFGVEADDEDVAALVEVLTKSLQTPSVMELLKKVSGKK